LEGLAMIDGGPIYGHLVYFVGRWYILWPFGIHILCGIGMFCGPLIYFMGHWYILWQFGIFYGNLVYFMGHLVYFFPFWYAAPRKIWQSWT
jgi:hypothetical protein